MTNLVATTASYIAHIAVVAASDVAAAAAVVVVVVVVVAAAAVVVVVAAAAVASAAAAGSVYDDAQTGIAASGVATGTTACAITMLLAE